MAERQLPKLHTRVRFPSPAPKCRRRKIRLLLAFDVALGFDDPPVANAHEVDAPHRACVIRSPEQPPSDLAAVAARDDALGFEADSRIGGDLRPKCDAGFFAL